MASAQMTTRIIKELRMLETNPPPGIAAWFRDADHEPTSKKPKIDINTTKPHPPTSRLDIVDAQITSIDPSSPYYPGTFTLELMIPPRYPFTPPNITFKTPVYHPNVDPQGRICLDLLGMPPKGAWKPSISICTLLVSIQILLSNPNSKDPLCVEIANEMVNQYDVFVRKAREWTRKYAVISVGSSGSGSVGQEECGGVGVGGAKDENGEDEKETKKNGNEPKLSGAVGENQDKTIGNVGTEENA